MRYFSSLKTSERISLSFSLFGFFSLLLFLILINITYFFIWYADQKEMSFRSMENNYYETIQKQEQITDVKNFRDYLLTRDTIIIPDTGELVCSPGVAKKIHEDVEIIKDKYLYKDGETIYFIYSKYFQGIGEVKVLFDTTPYITSQLIIIKTGLVFMLLVFVLQFFLGRYISGRLLKDLKSISKKLRDVDIDFHDKHITCQDMPEDDEIRILSEALNSSYDMIDKQTGKLKQFLTDVSHEFKTPLMAMSSKIDVLEKIEEKRELTRDEVEVFFGDTRQNILKLNGLLESLFFLSRIEEKELCLVKTSLHIKGYIEKRILKIAEAFPHKKLNYYIDVSDSLHYQVEESTFSILVDNLLSNAMKFAPQDMEIHIFADESSFSVSDNGPGIDQKEKKKIWDKFYRTDTNREGFGVGLYLVKRIISIYDWDINIDSKKGKGAVFKIRIR